MNEGSEGREYERSDFLFKTKYAHTLKVTYQTTEWNLYNKCRYLSLNSKLALYQYCNNKLWKKNFIKLK
jgi:hypothetical protein